jgi:Transposase DDE domain
LATAQTLYTADAGYHSDANLRALQAQGTPALVADNQMRQRDERFKNQDRYKPKDDVLYDKQPTGHADVKAVTWFRPEDFRFNGDHTCTCPNGKLLTSTGSIYNVGKGLRREDFKAKKEDCAACTKRTQCLRHPDRTAARKVVYFHTRQIDHDDPSHRMRQAIDSTRGRQLYSQRIGTVEPVFANAFCQRGHNKRLSRFNLRGKEKINTQWHLYCLVHNIEKLAHSGWQG